MEWTRQFDNYCERVDLTYWSEPINAITNASFLIAALILWPRTRGLPLGRALCVLLACIGVGSYLFHTHATVWAVTADVVPILLFTLLYFFAALFHFWGLPLWWALGGALAFLPYAAATVPVFNLLPFFQISAGYWPIAMLILGFGLAVRGRAPHTSNGLILGGALLCLSITLRSFDELVCARLPLGTHFLWHILNGVLLGWMIEVYRRHMLATRAARR
jgi:hypothetical protein